MPQELEIHKILENALLKSSNISDNYLLKLLENLSDAILFTDTKGKILFANNAAKDLFGNKLNNIKEFGYLFSFDVGILDKNTDIINYSPITVILDSRINTRIEAFYETEKTEKKEISIIGNYIKPYGYLFTFLSSNLKSISETYSELKSLNQQLMEKLKEDEALRTLAQSQSIRESLSNKISNAIRNSLEIGTILQKTVDELGKTLGCDRTFIIQNIDLKNETTIKYEYTSLNQKKLAGQQIIIEDDFFFQQAIETRQAISGNHVDQWDKDIKNKFKLIVPIIHHNELFGIIFLLRKNRQWNSEEINLVKSVADQVSISLKNAQLFEETTLKNIKISVLNEILKSINSSLILDDVFYTIGREIKRLINFDRASIAILEADSSKIKLFARIRNNGEVEILRTGPLISKGTAIYWAIENLKPILINVDENSEFADTFTLKKSGIKSSIIIPMINKGIVTGIFYLGSVKEQAYGQPEVDIMTQIAGQVAVAVENAKLYWQTQTQALKETLINQIISSIRKSLYMSDVLQATVNELGSVLGISYCFFRYYLNDDNLKAWYEFRSDNMIKILPDFYDIFNDLQFNKTNITVFKTTDSTINTKIKEFLIKNNIKSLLTIPISINDPLTNRNVTLGIIGLCHTDLEREWLVEDISLLKILADQVIITISQSRLFEQTEKQKLELEKTIQKLKETQTQLIQSEKMAALGQLVAGVAHEINTPIGSINSNNTNFTKCVNKLKQEIKNISNPPTKAIQLLEIMEETIKINSLACERINDLVKSLKNFARLDESELKRVDIHEGINSTLTLLRHELKSKIQIISNFSELPLVECYPNLINQVFMNLLINAIQSIESKGTISITTNKSKDNISISITDTGIGISEENLNKVFDPGFTTKGVGVGTGLGLSICYQIIEKHKGQISVSSIPNQGSTFTVEIPVNYNPR